MSGAAPAVELKLLDTRLEEWGFPHWGSALAAGLDLHACVAEPRLIEAQAPAVLIPAGFALSIGDGDWAALVYPRSGMGHKRGLVLGNGVGVVDADYQGELFVSAWNRNPPGSAPIEIMPGERIAQLVFTRVARPQFRLVTSFAEASERGSGGYGSTGTGPRSG
ncbi:MAG TPA: dUTP diphosphatase [Aliidongia sp.]|nr:dUTP diphosphatase [Aliidongia sp.]